MKSLDIDSILKRHAQHNVNDAQDMSFLDGNTLDVYRGKNEFETIERLYAEWFEWAPHLLLSRDFAERRIACAMNPEYTERCLLSDAFADVRDEILKRLNR